MESKLFPRRHLLAAAACALITLGTTAPAQAQYGRAEITLQNTHADAIRGQLVNTMMNRGFRIASDSPSLLVFEKAADNPTAMLLFGSRFNMVPLSRVSYTIAEISGSTRIVADVALIGNPGSAFERRNDLNTGSDRDDAQQILNGLATSAPPPVSAADTNRIVVRDGKLTYSQSE